MNIDKEWQSLKVGENELTNLKNEHPEIIIVDESKRNLEELFLLRNPKYKFDKNYKEEFENFFDEYDNAEFGSWFYFSWINTAVRFLPEEMHNELRTGRNKYLITEEEQIKFYNATIAFLGMSVGSHVAIVVAMTGGAKHMKLADPDTLSGDNLNRVRGGFHGVGINKTILIARQIYEINPYSEVEIFPEGITDENAEKIISNVTIIIEEMDNMYWKFRSRELARARGIPVVMGTDNGDGAIVDIERYDMDKKLPFFNGLAKGLSAENLKNMIPTDLPKVAAKIAGANLAVPKMLHSVTEVGRSLYSWPQLGTAANLCGSVVSMLARRIINGDQNIRSGRYSVNPDSIFESDYKRKWLSRKLAFFQFVRTMMKRG